MGGEFGSSSSGRGNLGAQISSRIVLGVQVSVGGKLVARITVGEFGSSSFGREVLVAQHPFSVPKKKNWMVDCSSLRGNRGGGGGRATLRISWDVVKHH